MSFLSPLHNLLTKPITFGIKLWILIITFISLFLLLIFILVIVFHICYRRRKRNRQIADQETAISKLEKVSTEMEIANDNNNNSTNHQKIIVTDLEMDERRRRSTFLMEEIQLATNGFDVENIIGMEDFGVDYFGILADGRKVIVKKLNANNSFGDKEFIREADRMRHISHKNLVKLIGYYTQGTHNNRMLVYENVDNGNLHQWLHGSPQQLFSPLTWPIRMNIIQGIAKGLAYLHEDVEPQILHGNLKSSSILLDQQWNPKITDFGLDKFFSLEYSPASSLTIETFGNESLENESTSPFTEKNDVYNFGILVMEMITGRITVDCKKSQPYLIEWVKSKVESEEAGETVDSKLEEKPLLKELKRMLLIALRCVDPEIEVRPKMAHILHMLEPRDLLLIDGPRIKRVSSRGSSAAD